MLYNFIKAKNIKNKLGVKEGVVFSIEKVELLKEGFKVYVQSMFEWYSRDVYDIYYNDRDAFDKEWELLSWEDVFKGRLFINLRGIKPYMVEEIYKNEKRADHIKKIWEGYNEIKRDKENE